MPTTVSANEKTSLVVTASLLDTAGDAVPGSALDVLQLTIHLYIDRSQRIRSSDDVLNDDYITISEAGLLTWNVRPYETQILNPSNVPMGRTEKHRAVFEFAYESAATGGLTNPFATVLGSQTVTVTHPSHGLLVRDNIYFVDAVDCGGLDIGGHYIVREVVDADTYRITHQDAATATETGGGGTPTWFANGKAGSADVLMIITRFDPV